jgi:P-type Ca2+ transporter type 2C
VTERDRTMAFTTFVMFDMFNALGCRSTIKSIFSIGASCTVMQGVHQC